jgi:UDPglucose 6-dehydrogenase
MVNKISVIGLGKLGAPLVYFLASKGFTVYGYDVSTKISEKLKKKQNPFFLEENLDSYIKKYNKLVHIKDTLSSAVNNTDITFLILPTPSLKNGKFDNSYLVKSLKQIVLSIKSKKKFHLINITSTVMPTSCDKIFKKILNKSKNCNFGLVYNPHFIALGSVINNMENPDLLLIGSDCKRSKDLINQVYKKVYTNKKNKNFISNLNLYEAEIAKISVNSYVTMKISFSNFISNLVQNSKIKSRSSNILNAIAKDTRIGKKCLSVGTKFSGPCFPRDNIAIREFCKDIKSSYFLPLSTDKENNIQSERYIEYLKNLIKKIKIKKPRIGIMGVTYKPNTDVIEKSPGLDLLRVLNKKYKVSFFDPYTNTKSILNSENILGFNKFINLNDIFFLCYIDKKFDVRKIKFKINKKKYLIDLWDYYKINSYKGIQIVKPSEKI